MSFAIIFFEAAPCDLPALRVFSSLVECCSGRAPACARCAAARHAHSAPTSTRGRPPRPAAWPLTYCRPFKNAHPPRAPHPCWQDGAARRALAHGLHGRLQLKRLQKAAGGEVEVQGVDPLDLRLRAWRHGYRLFVPGEGQTAVPGGSGCHEPVGKRTLEQSVHRAFANEFPGCTGSSHLPI